MPKFSIVLVVLRRHSVATGGPRICGIHSAEGGARGHWAVPDTKDVYTHTFILHICKSSLRNAEDMRFAFKFQLSKFTKRASPLLTPSFSLSCRLLPIRRQETDVTMEVGCIFFSEESFMPNTGTSRGTNRGGGRHTPRLRRSSAGG